MNKKKAFTLAEVLITLVIIGIIAAVTVPSIINNTNNEELISRLKKTFSTLSQATDQIIMEEGPATVWAKSTDDVYNLYKKHINITKDCGTERGCFPKEKYKFLNGNNDSVDWDGRTDFKRVVLADGTSLLFAEATTDCNMNNPGNNGTKKICASFIVDINGLKGPNAYGKDLFSLSLKENGLYPAGCDIDNLCNKNYFGWACACKVLYEGNMNY